MAFSGMDLKVNGSGTDLTEIGTIIDREAAGDGLFAIQGRLTGAVGDALSFQAVNGSARRGSLNIVLNGEIKDLIAFSGVDLKVKGSGRDLAEVGALIDGNGRRLMHFLLKGRLTGATEALSLMNAQGTARRGRLHLTLNGTVKNLLTLRGMDLQSKLTGTDLTEFGEILEAKLPATDQFEIQGRLTGSVKTLALQEAGGSAKRGSLNIALSGEVKDLIDSAAWI